MVSFSVQTGSKWCISRAFNTWFSWWPNPEKFWGGLSIIFSVFSTAPHIHLRSLQRHHNRQCSHVVPQTAVLTIAVKVLGMLHYTLIPSHCIEVDIERLLFSLAVKLDNFWGPNIDKKVINSSNKWTCHAFIWLPASTGGGGGNLCPPSFFFVFVWTL